MPTRTPASFLVIDTVFLRTQATARQNCVRVRAYTHPSGTLWRRFNDSVPVVSTIGQQNIQYPKQQRGSSHAHTSTARPRKPLDHTGGGAVRDRRRYSDESQMPHARYAAFTRDASHIHQSAGAVTDNVGHFGDAGGRGFDTLNVRTFFFSFFQTSETHNAWL